jgi:hypothetical protein
MIVISASREIFVGLFYAAIVTKIQFRNRTYSSTGPETRWQRQTPQHSTYALIYSTSCKERIREGITRKKNTDPPWLTQFQRTQFLNYNFFNKIKKLKNNVFETWAEFFLAGKWKRSETKVTEVYCWAITLAAGLSCCGLSGSSVPAFRFQLDPLVHTLQLTAGLFNSDLHNIRVAPHLPERNSRVSRGVSVRRK